MMSAPLSSTASIETKSNSRVSEHSSNYSASNCISAESVTLANEDDRPVDPTSQIVNTRASPQGLRFLVVDESRQVRQMCLEVAKGFGFEGSEAATIPAAREALKRKDTALVVLDLTQSESIGQSFLVEIKALRPNALVIAMSASATIPSAVQTMQIGAFDYLSKPFPLHILTQAFDRAIKRNCFDMERRKLQASTPWSGMGDVLGQSTEMEKLYRILSKVADSRHPVMIVGESGTGKSLAARSIHSNGPDRNKPFVSVDCKSLSPSELEDLLFGDVKREPRGANSQKRGLLHSREGGTVLLDGIEHIILDLQARLAKILRTKRFGLKMKLTSEASLSES